MDKSTMDATQDRSMKEKLMGIVGTFMNSLWIVWLMIVIKNLIVDALSRKFKFNFVFTVGDGIAIILITSIVVFTVHLVERFILVKEENNEALLLREWASLSGTLATVILLVFILIMLFLRFLY